VFFALEPDERAVIERASVEGRLFHRSAVAELAPPHVRGAVSAHLLALVRKEFIRPDQAEFRGDDAFRFGHILIRDAAYESMPKQIRAGLHERFAINIGDIVRFDILGRIVNARVSSIRDVDFKDARAGGFMFVFALLAEVAAGMDALGIGWTLTPFAASFLVASLVGSRAAQRDPVRLMQRGAVIAAVSLAALGLVLLATWPGFTSWQLALPLLGLGAGQGMLVVPLYGTVLGGVPAHHAGMGGGVLITTTQMALGLGSALVGTVFLQLGGATGGAGPVEVVLGASIALLLVTALVAGQLRAPER